jgi:hypothetical protein
MCGEEGAVKLMLTMDIVQRCRPPAVVLSTVGRRLIQESEVPRYVTDYREAGTYADNSRAEGRVDPRGYKRETGPE